MNPTPHVIGFITILVVIKSSLLPAGDLVHVRDGRISGRVVSMAEDGTVVVQPDLLPDSLTFTADLLVGIDFNPGEKKNVMQESHLTLANGDTLPCTVRRWQDEVLEVDSPGLGSLRIPRENLQKIQTAARSAQPLVTPAVALAGWKRWMIDGVEHGIKFTTDPQRQRLIVKGAAGPRLHTDLMGPFTVRFIYECTNQPNIALNFPLTDKAGNSKDSGLFQIVFKPGEAVIRGRAGQNEQLVVPDLKQGCRVAVELQIDPSRALARLSMNGRLFVEMTELKGLTEPFGGFEFRSSTGELETQFIEGFRIDTWDVEGDRLRRWQPQQTDRDTLFERAAGSLAGRLLAIRTGTGQDRVEFATDEGGKSPRKFAASEVLAIHFAERKDSDHAADSATPPGFEGTLRSGARLSLTHCLITGDFVHIEHPLLGKLQVARAEMATLNRTQQISSRSDP